MSTNVPSPIPPSPTFTPPSTKPPKARRLKKWHWVLIVVGVVLVMGMCGGLLNALSGSQTQTSQRQATQQPTRQPTATPKPLSLTGGVLGSYLNDFTSKYGSPIMSTSGGNQYEPISVNGIAAFLFVQTPGDNSSASNRVYSLIVRPIRHSDITWTQKQSQTVAKAFLPPDATHVQDRTVQLDEGPVVEHIYRSKLLAAAFPTDAFYDILTGNLVEPGTFNVTYGGPLNEDGACVFWLGE